ncbi:putative uncharacterized protein [Aliivibrio wodanis]|uniref:DUF2971 domain-containing protein n=1 Tax=Aliivibrio wodanis TaxID=80852 RepID=A0A090ISS3_9GAMM|nr:putative uncharacterized protein [Aliivibrio wodanis]
MNEYLYKYTKFREDFLSDPYIRATQIEGLNDPFEANVTLEQIIKARKQHNEFYDVSEEFQGEDFDYMMEEFLSLSQQDLSEIGVISLTEDPINPLMWAHYADEHKGVVLQVKNEHSFLCGANEYIGGKRVRYNKDIFGFASELPKPVAYRRNRPQFDFIEEVAPEHRQAYPHKKFNEKLIYTKANDWLYEKESRSVVYLKDADRIVCSYDEHTFKFCDNHEFLTVKNLSDNRIQIDFPINFGNILDFANVDDALYDEYEDRNDLYLWTRGLDAQYFFKLNPSSISAFIFGCKSSFGDIEITKQKLSWDADLYKAKISKDKFELDLEKI